MQRNVTAAYKRRRKNRRKAAVRKALFALGSICLAAMTAFVMTGFISKADTDTNEEVIGTKYFTSIEIADGDTIWDLSENYIDYHYETKQDYISEVVSINSLDDADDIISGQYIIMPYYK